MKSPSMIPLMFRSITILLACGLLVAGCNLRSAAKANEPGRETGEGVRILAATVAAPTPLDATSAPTSAPSKTPIMPSPTPDRCAAGENRPARRINADVKIDYPTKAASVEERIEFFNREETALDEIVLDVQANQWEDSFWLEELSVNGSPANYELQRNRLQVQPHEPLAPGCWLEIGLKFRLQPAEIRDGLRSYRGFFGYSPRQLNLGHFLPTVAARLAGVWRIHEPVGIGEQVVYEVADWRVNVAVEEASESLELVAPGAVKSISAGRWEINLPRSRDFAMSLSEDFIVTEMRISDDLTLAVYSFADAHISAGGQRFDGAAHTAREAAKAIELFGRLFGVYERERLVIVQGDFPDGMEFTGLVFVGSAWFYQFDGGPRNYLTLISIHEIAHQWWYARVGNDAAVNPWLDEALATYSEYLFIEAHFPNERNWWWSFRVAAYFPQGMVDSSVYEFSTPRQYINAIYLRGVQMLHNLRQDVGDDAFFELLRAYGAAGADRIADSMLFWSHLSATQRRQTEATRSEFLRDPTVNALLTDAEAEDSLADSAMEEQEAP